MHSRKPVNHWKQRHRQGLPVMSQKQMKILQDLRAAKRNDSPFQYLDDVHPKTLRSLTRNDWVFESKGDDKDRTRYRITLRGEQALAVYEKPPRYRTDGICPQCNERPRRVDESGEVQPYCLECSRELGRKAYAKKGHRKKPNQLCPSCRERTRYQYPSGHIIAYCKPCRDAKRKEEKRRKNERLLERIKQGELILCVRCKERPRYHGKKVVYDYCRECYRYQQNLYSKKKLVQRIHELLGEPQ
jgi:hypothetical protein